MEQDQNSENQGMQNESVFPQNSPSVSFPTAQTPKKSGGPKTLLIIGILILVGILGFVIYKSASKNNDVISEDPTPFDNLTTSDQTTQIATPTSSPSATIKPADKSAVSIEIQNGTGITGEAAYLQSQLKTLGYTDIKVGNASSTGATATTVTFDSSLSNAVVAELTQKLNALYTTVTVKTATSATTDVVIVTGLRKGATVKPLATPTATPGASASPSAIPTSTPQ